MTITLTGDPQSTQHIYRYACRGNFPGMYMTKKGKDLKEQYQLEARTQWRGKPLKGDLSLAVRLYFDTRHTHDIDNFNKLWMDALTGIMYEDDSQIVHLNISKSHEPGGARIEIMQI